MEDYRSEERLNEDNYILEERKFYLDLLQTKRDTTRKEIKDRIINLNTSFNKNLTEEKSVQSANWEDIIETMGYIIVRNKLYQEVKDYTTYHGSRTIPPMQPCLCKVFLQKEHKKNYNIKSMERLVKVILSLKSERIVKLLGAIEVVQTEKMYFFEELTKMPLTNYFRANKTPLDAIKAKTWFLELASALLYMHNHGFAHQKVNLDSVYITQNGDSIKLGCPDALAEQVSYELIKAFSKFADLQRPLKKNQFSSYELAVGESKNYDAMAADVWALGVLLYYFYTLNFPFKGWKNKKELTTEVQCKRWSFIGMMDNNPRLDEATKVFLSKIFVSSPEARLTMHEIIVDAYLYKKTDETPPPLPPIPEPTPSIKTELEEEFDFTQNERQNNINNLKAFHESYTEKYRFKRFKKFQQQVVQYSLNNKVFDKVNYEEGMQKDVKVLRTNLIYEANEAQLYEGQILEDHCYVKIDSLPNFLKKYHVKNIDNHLKMWLQLKNPDKFIQLLKCYTVQNKIYLFINADKSMQRLSEKFLDDSPVNISLARVWTRQLIDSMHFLHSKGLAVLYLDPEYIFIKNSNQLIIGQMESLYSIFSFDEPQDGKTTYPPKNSIKTPFAAPEALYTDTIFDPFAAGIWTIAAIIYKLMFLRCPFEVKVKKTYLEQIEQKRWLHIFDKKFKLHNDFFSLFDSVFVENPEARPIAIELMFSTIYKASNGDNSSPTSSAIS